jgi:hypothetical protein
MIKFEQVAMLHREALRRFTETIQKLDKEFDDKEGHVSAVLILTQAIATAAQEWATDQGCPMEVQAMLLSEAVLFGEALSEEYENVCEYGGFLVERGEA